MRSDHLSKHTKTHSSPGGENGDAGNSSGASGGHKSGGEEDDVTSGLDCVAGTGYPATSPNGTHAGDTNNNCNNGD